MKRRLFPLPGLAFLALLVPLGLPGALRPAGPDDWPDARQERVEKALQDAAREARAAPRRPLVALRHGDVRLVAGLARVDVVLVIRNDGSAPLAWQRAFEVDPGAEVVGASLRRGAGEAVAARTLTLAQARAYYREVLRPRTRTLPRRPPSGDPLRVERTRRNRLDVSVWPVAAGETVQVDLTFVTPLLGRGSRRAYSDVIQGDMGPDTPGPAAPNPTPVVTPPDRWPASAVALAMDTDWIVRSGALRLVGTPVGMTPAGRIGDAMRFVAAAPRRDRIPTLPFATPETSPGALAVPGGGLGSRVAIWRFVPIGFLRKHDLDVGR
ncbi:MAG: hypothetical protein ACC662_05230, partial [Planctomycetota bacterium]